MGLYKTCNFTFLEIIDIDTPIFEFDDCFRVQIMPLYFILILI